MEELKKWLVATGALMAMTANVPHVSAYVTERGNPNRNVCKTDTDSDSDSDGGSTGEVTGNGDMHTDVSVKWDNNNPPLSRADVKKLAKAAAKAGKKSWGFKMDAGLIYAQWAQESGQDFNANPPLNCDHFNLGGLSAGGGIPEWLAKKGVTKGSAHGEGDGIYFYFPNYGVFAETYISGYYKAVPKALKEGTKSGSKDADLKAYVHTLKANGYFTASESGYLGGVTTGYAIYNGADDVADNVSDSTTDLSSDSCATQTPSENDGDVEKIAGQMVGYFVGHYQQMHKASLVSDKDESAEWSVSDIKKNGYTDCSGFVWTVLKVGGYNVPANMGWNTATMAADAKGAHKYLKKIDSNGAKKGTVVTAGGTGDSGHTVILAEDWHGDDTQVYSMGSDKGVIKRAYKYVMSSHPSSSATFCTPVKK